MVPLPMHMVDDDADVADEIRDFPSHGSYAHYSGSCKPCAFMHNKGCENGLNCPFCHLCEPGEKKKRKKEKQLMRKDAKVGNGRGHPWMTRMSNGLATALPAGLLS